jgi:CDP-diacylglycerol--serine O-phosphatidyltransferase
MLRAGLHPANLVTYLGAGLAVGAIALALRGETLLSLAVATLVGIADLVDGAWARRFTRLPYERRFGAALDSLADMIGFVALPIVVVGTAGVPWWLAVPSALIYAWAGLTRLAAYGADVPAQTGADQVPSAPLLHYRGVPVTFAALVLPLAGLVGALAPGPVGLWCCAALVILACGFVSNVAVRKPAPRAYPLFGLLALAVIAALLVVRG